MKKYCRRLAGWTVLFALAWPGAVLAQEQDQVIVVPYSQKNPDIPHPAHEDAHITLKAIVRNAQCANYNVTWDTNRNNVYDDYTRTVSREGNTLTVRDIGRTFLVPAVDRDQSFNINVKVRNNCTGVEKFGTFRLFVYDFRPSNDPRNWTAEQLEIMAAMMVQEAMWYHHRQQNTLQNRDTALIYGRSPYDAATSVAMWQFTVNGHLPAYPPGTINRHGINLPNGWEAENDRRWNIDPYAETVTRYMNRMTGSYNRYGIPAAEESNEHGYRWVGNHYQATTSQRLPNTTDGHGISLSWYSNSYTYTTGMSLGALATALPAMAGTPLQNGPTGWLWERYIQEATDYLGYMQIDGGCGKGGWYYDARDGSYGCVYGDFSTTQWAFVGFEAASVVGEPYGVFVNNRHKYRVAAMILSNQRSDGGAAYDSAGRPSNFKMTGGAILAHRMIGTHNMANDDRVPFPNEQATITAEWASNCPGCGYNSNMPLTHRVMIDSYNRHLNYASTYFTRHGGANGTYGSIGWQDGQWEQGNYLCGNTNAIYNVRRCGDTYTMYSHQKGYATGLPELSRVGPHDWRRMYDTYYIRAQDRVVDVNNPLTGYDEFGRVYDQFCERWNTTCNYGSGHLGAAMAGLVETPTVFNPKPVALATVQPNRVTEGCSGANAGRVIFDHSESFHPDAGATIVAYQWDVDSSPAGGGLWWDNNGQPDFQTDDPNVPFEFQYLTRGNYTATLRVVDSAGQSKTTTVTVTVDAAANLPPDVGHGGPYALEVGQNLQLRSNVTDQNLACGDAVTVAWDLDNDGAFDDANGASPNVAWAVLQNLPVGQANRVRVRARDLAGAESIAETTLTIYPRDPVARGRANPNPAACRAEVTFDGSASSHPNPNRAISQYDWNVDGVGGNDGTGQIFRYVYPAFGDYNVTLTVRDDLGRTNSTSFVVNVNQGNQPPVARVASNAITVLEGDALTLDGRGSTDPNTNCGDSIVSYAWDINGNGSFADAVDIANSANPTLQWAALLAAGLRVADPATGLPTNTVTLRVTDEFGRTATAPVTVTLLEALPEVVVVQNPNPASVRLDNGLLQTALDGRESRSPVPGVTIQTFDWDLDNDGVFETANRAVVNFQRVVPEGDRQPGRLPRYTVGLRVTDSTGRTNTGTYEVVLTVPPTPPTADADPTDPPERGYDILVGEDLALDASQSSDPDSAQAGDYLRFFRWDLTYNAADGFRADITRQAANAQEQQAASRTVVTWAQLQAAGINGPGTYTIRVQVEDITNLTSEDSAPLRVHAVAPVAQLQANPNPAACGGRVTFDASASTHPHPGIDIVGYAWDFDGDGNADAAGEVTTRQFDAFTFGQPNTVALTVTDSRNNTATASV
ncbi:MAG: PKD domain-containing protein, partial [Myxococcales bacterium]|nr:PKD domain-containing protein [Myxococcales bacterium]